MFTALFIVLSIFTVSLSKTPETRILLSNSLLCIQNTELCRLTFEVQQQQGLYMYS